MRNVYECEYCGKIFYEKQECLNHEINEHSEMYKYKKIIYDTLNSLNKKYNMNKLIKENSLIIDIKQKECEGFSYANIDLSFYIDEYEIKETSSADLIIDKIKKSMNECFLLDVNSVEGTLDYEEFCGGDGADDYIINGIYLKDLLLNKEGKYIKIEITDKKIEEAVKPLSQTWISVNFENQGYCPKCKAIVVDGYGKTDKNCPKCGVKLDWR